MVEAGGERKTAVDRDEPVRRLEADDAAAGGGDADRAAGVGSQGRVGEPGRERRSRASRRAAGDPSRCDRVRDSAEVRVLRRDAVRELVQIRLADVRVPAGLCEVHGFRGGGRHVFGEHRRAVRRRQPCRVEQVLDPKPDACARLLRDCEKDPVGRHVGDLTGYRRRFGFVVFLTSCTATRRVTLAP